MSPLYAALTARLMNIHGKETVQMTLKNGGYYTGFSYNDVTQGDNGGYSATNGWDSVTGQGSFNKLLSLNLGPQSKSDLFSSSPKRHLDLKLIFLYFFFSFENSIFFLSISSKLQLL